jgi:hypothetical protein
MHYIYKKNNSYIYKRRIPRSKKFFTFVTKTTNKKEAIKISLFFTKLSYNLFDYIKRTDMTIDSDHLYKILNDYKKKALEEYSQYEKDRHKHLGNLFDIKEDNPLLHKPIKLDGASRKVMKKAIKNFELLATGNFETNKTALTNIGKDIVARATPDIKAQFKEARNSKDPFDLMFFLSLLFKKEVEIIQEDRERTKKRFKEPQKAQQVNIQEQVNTNQNTVPLEELQEDFLFRHLGYKKDQLDNSSSQAYKKNFILNVFKDFMYDENRNATSQDITIDTIAKFYEVLLYLPIIRNRQDKTQYELYNDFIKAKDKSKYQRKNETSYKDSFKLFGDFCNYLFVERYLDSSLELRYDRIVKNIRKQLEKDIIDKLVEPAGDKEAFKIEMLQCIFTKRNPFYAITIDNIIKGKKLRKNQDEHTNIFKFYIPLVLFFTGSRITEISRLRIDDCEIREFPDGQEKVILYIYAKKNRVSKRIVILHDFITNELRFLDFLKMRILEKKSDTEHLFGEADRISGMMSKDFNKDKSCIKAYYTREDEFLRSRYTLNSFRHTFKTYMTHKDVKDTVIKKLQGHSTKGSGSHANYVSSNTSLNAESLNENFDLHHQINWDDIITTANIIVSK